MGRCQSKAHSIGSGLTSTSSCMFSIRHWPQNQCRPTPTFRIVSPTLDTPLQPNTDILLSKFTSDIPEKFKSTPNIQTPFMGPNRVSNLDMWMRQICQFPPTRITRKLAFSNPSPTEFESTLFLLNLNPNPNLDSYFPALNLKPNPGQKALNPNLNPNPD